jgi:selT/selW/selH-like putative selenoprotein
MASSLQAAIKQEFGITADLKAGHGGVFDVAIDGGLAYSKHETHRFPTNEEIFAKIRALPKKS